jgi:hypothetical protein
MPKVGTTLTPLPSTHKHRSGTSLSSIFQPSRIPTLPLSSTTSFAQVCSGGKVNVKRQMQNRKDVKVNKLI